MGSALLGLLGVLAGPMFSAASRGDDTPNRPLESSYVPEKTSGTVVLHPAALAKRVGGVPPFAQLLATCNDAIGSLNALIPLTVPDPAAQAQLRLDLAGIETVVVPFETQIAGRLDPTALPGKTMILTGKAGGFTVRTVSPFDWLGLLRALPLNLKEVQDGDRTYHTILVPKTLCPGDVKDDIPFAIYLPDDRTMVVEGGSFIKKLIHGTGPATPAYLAGDTWGRISQSPVAVALDNTADALLRGFDPTLSEPEGVLVMERLRGLERLLAGVDLDAQGSLTLVAEGTARDAALAQSIAASVGLYTLMGRSALAFTKPSPAATDQLERRLLGQLCRGVRIAATGRTINLTLRDCFTAEDLALFLFMPEAMIDAAVQPAKLETLPAAPAKLEAFPAAPAKLEGLPRLLDPDAVPKAPPPPVAVPIEGA